MRHVADANSRRGWPRFGPATAVAHYLVIGALMAGGLPLAPANAQPEPQPRQPAAQAPKLRDATPAERMRAHRLVTDLARPNADVVRRAEDALVELGKVADIEDLLQSAVVSNNLETAWRARRILNKLDREILGFEFFQRRWHRQAVDPDWEPSSDKPTAETDADRHARLEAERAAQAAAAELTLQGVLVAPARIELHPNPSVGDYVTYQMGDGVDALTETWAVVEITESSAIVEHHTNLLEPVAMLFEIDRHTGHVIRAFGGREGQAVLAPIGIGSTAVARVTGEVGAGAAPVRVIAGEFADATSRRHSVEVPDLDGPMTVEVDDTICPRVPFHGLLRRVDVETETVVLELSAWGTDFVRSAFPTRLVTVMFDGKRYEIAEPEYLAHQADYDAHTRQPPTIYRPLDLPEPPRRD